MQPVIIKTIRIPLGILSKVEAARKAQSFNRFAVEALQEKANRDISSTMR